MGPRPELTRASFSLPGGREWVALEHSDGVYFVASATERIGPLPDEAAHREAARQNEGELIVALAEAILTVERGHGLDELATEPRFASAFDRRLAAAIAVLHERGEYDECTETERGPVVLVDRFLALIGPGEVVMRECDSPGEAEDYFVNWHLRELELEAE